MSYISTHQCRIEDKSGEMLLCEFQVFEAPRHLKVQSNAEITLKSVTFKDGAGVEVSSDHAHAQFVVLLRDDVHFQDHRSWPDIEERCAAAFMRCQSSEVSYA